MSNPYLGSTSINRESLMVPEKIDIEELSEFYQEKTMSFIKGQEVQKKERCNKLHHFLRFISLGKYQTKLYSNGEVSESSSIGGCITLIMAILIISYASYVMFHIFNKDIYHIEKEAH